VAAAQPEVWHWPLPAGEWQISRGPCGAETLFDHDCAYYENKCAIDFVPLTGSIENVPVLAPAAGEVFFVGTRAETGLMLILQHTDGRASGYMHLNKIVVLPDEKVKQGQVIAYAGSSGNVRPHLHFWVQPNVVERECENFTADKLSYRDGRITSQNLTWSGLTLSYPPEVLPDWLPTVSGWPGTGPALPTRLVLTRGARVVLPVAVKGAFDATDALALGSFIAPLTRRAPEFAIFNLPLAVAQPEGDYVSALTLSRNNQRLASVRYTVRAFSAPVGYASFLAQNPELVSPLSWSSTKARPRLCWRVDFGKQTVKAHYRAVLIGPTSADSGWLTQTCWTPPALASGTYYWKVFVRDETGAMNRPNQRPWAFVAGK